MYFGLRGKVALLVIVATAASALLVAKILSDRAEEVLRNHELVDLGDEASLRGWILVDQMDGLRDDVVALANDPRFAKAVMEEEASLEDLQEMAQTISRRYWKRHLRIEVFEWGQEVKEHRVIEQKALLPYKDLWLPNLQEATGSGYHLSPIARKRINRTEKPGVQNSGNWEPIVTAVAPINWNHAEAVAARPRLFVRIVMSLNIQNSPRHLFALENLDGEQLLRHDEYEAEERGNDEVFRTFTQDETVRSALMRALENSQDKVDDSGNPIIEEKPKVVRLVKTEYVPLNSNYFFIEGVPGESLQQGINFESEEELSTFLEDLVTSSEPLGRVGGLRMGVSEIRILAQTKKKLEKLQSKITDALKDRYGVQFDEIQWRSPVECDELHAWTVLVFTGSGEHQRPYVLHYCVLDDELASSIQHEMETLRKIAIIVAAGFGMIGFLISIFFIRPLKRMTKTAQKITESHPEKLYENLGKLVRGLDTRRRDEVGDISRASKRLFQELIEFHEQLEQRVSDRTRELRKANIDLEQANEQLMSLSNEKDAFVAKVSHDLRQPLNAIFLQVEALKLSELDEMQMSDVQRIHDHARRELNLVNDILEYQKIIMGAETLTKEEIEIETLINDLQEAYGPEAEAKGFEFEVRHHKDIGSIQADDRRLRQVLGNLISNACKFTKEGSVTIDARPRSIGEENWVEFTITDTGRGMSPEEQSKVFVPFVSNKKDNAGGTGLGLSICKELTARMGGKIGFVSELGKGTHFSVFMPRDPKSKFYDADRGADSGKKNRSRSDRASTAVHSAKSAVEALPETITHGGKVLVIDDDHNVRELLCRLLGENGYTVITAEDGNEGLRLAREEQPDAITLDVVMPGGKDGWEVLKNLKESPDTEKIPVIMVSVMAESENGIALDVEDYLVKPIDVNRLLRVMSRVAQESMQRNLLLVDDDEDSMDSLKRILDDAGWQATTATNGKIALEILEKTRPAAIVLDLMMPEMDGFEFLQRVRTDPNMSSIPVIVMTGKVPSPEEESFLRDHVATILTKGDSSAGDLIQSIKERIRSSG